MLPAPPAQSLRIQPHNQHAHAHARTLMHTTRSKLCTTHTHTPAQDRVDPFALCRQRFAGQGRLSGPAVAHGAGGAPPSLFLLFSRSLALSRSLSLCLSLSLLLALALFRSCSGSPWFAHSRRGAQVFLVMGGSALGYAVQNSHLLDQVSGSLPLWLCPLPSGRTHRGVARRRWRADGERADWPPQLPHRGAGHHPQPLHVGGGVLRVAHGQRVHSPPRRGQGARPPPQRGLALSPPDVSRALGPQRWRCGAQVVVSNHTGMGVLLAVLVNSGAVRAVRARRA